MDSLVDFPQPPLVPSHPSNEVEADEEAVINLREGRKLVGNLVSFDLQNQLIWVKHPKHDQPVELPFNDFKLLTLPKARIRVKAEQDDTAQHLEMAAQPTEFEITFTDGDSLSGETLGFRNSEGGLFLFPILSVDQYICTLAPHSAIEHCRMGKHLGEVLVEDNVATSEQVAFALQEQEQLRQRPLGEYLKDKAIVDPNELASALTRQKAMPQMRLGEVLVAEKLITEEQLEEALSEQHEDRSRPLGELLIAKGLVTKKAIQKTLAKKLGIPFVDLRTFPISPQALDLIPQSLACSYRLIPLTVMNGNKLACAMEDPLNGEAVDQLRFKTGLHIEPVLAPAEDLDYAYQIYFQNQEADSSLEELTAEGEDPALEPESETSSEEEVVDNVVVKLINKIIMDAYNQGASDIHIEPRPGKERVLVRLRKDGSLIKYHELPAQYRAPLISRIKIMSHLDISERRRPQDGKIAFKRFGPANIELRVATIPTAGGLEDVVLRILAGGKPMPIERLGLSENNLTTLQDLATKPYGMLLVCGPTGAGKTTTLHSVLSHINTPERKIWTAEDPVEITQQGLRQVQVNPKAGVTFASAMRAFLRADPDVIMVGEMRDQETTHIGVEASLTGHLVLSTLHTNSAPESITRLLDMGMDPFNFADALLGILAQRLAKRLCSSCRQPWTPHEAELEEILEEYCLDITHHLPHEAAAERREAVRTDWQARFNDKGEFVLNKAVGCEQCNHTGYRGRIGIHEVLEGTDTIKKLIVEKATISQILQTGLEEGMRTLKQDGIEKVLAGETDIHQIRAVCIR